MERKAAMNDKPNGGNGKPLKIENGRDKVAKIGPLMSRAMEDIKGKVIVLLEKTYGRCPIVTDKDALEIIGWKYLQKNYGKATANDIAMIIGTQR